MNFELGAHVQSFPNNMDYILQSRVRGYHIFRRLGKSMQLPCQCKNGNCADQFVQVIVFGNKWEVLGSIYCSHCFTSEYTLILKLRHHCFTSKYTLLFKFRHHCFTSESPEGVQNSRSQAFVHIIKSTYILADVTTQGDAIINALNVRKLNVYVNSKTRTFLWLAWEWGSHH